MFRRREKELVALVHGVQAELTMLREDIARRAAELDAVRGGLRALEDRLHGVDARVTHMTTAITNQLHELDSEIDRLAKTADAASAETVSELRANQVRIAGEQARYAIALRQDLAELAELLRRARG
jgi:predicted  nucleic acid-binding Zn-ribbon protein